MGNVQHSVPYYSYNNKPLSNDFSDSDKRELDIHKTHAVMQLRIFRENGGMLILEFVELSCIDCRKNDVFRNNGKN
jgi:hypothetical protein